MDILHNSYNSLTNCEDAFDDVMWTHLASDGISYSDWSPMRLELWNKLRVPIREQLWGNMRSNLTDCIELDIQRVVHGNA